MEDRQFDGFFDRWRKVMTGLACHQKVLRCDAPSTYDMETVADEKERKNLEYTCALCEKWRDELVTESPIVRFLLTHVSLLKDNPGSPSTMRGASRHGFPVAIECQPCSVQAGGGFSPERGVVLCSNKMMSKRALQDTLSHELIHAWDSKRFKLDWDTDDLRVQACTEIRAENLSGDCRWRREVMRREFGFVKHQQKCVRDRAILSVSMNPKCKSLQDAERAVDEVWQSCWQDTRPFDEIY